MTDSQPDPLDPDDGYNRDPGASAEDAGVPEVSDDMMPGTGAAPEPELASVPTEEPVEADAYGTTAREQAEHQPLDERLAAEEPEDYTEPDSAKGRPTPAPGGAVLESGYITDEP